MITTTASLNHTSKFFIFFFFFFFFGQINISTNWFFDKAVELVSFTLTHCHYRTNHASTNELFIGAFLPTFSKSKHRIRELWKKRAFDLIQSPNLFSSIWSFVRTIKKKKNSYHASHFNDLSPWQLTKKKSPISRKLLRWKCILWFEKKKKYKNTNKMSPSQKHTLVKIGDWHPPPRTTIKSLSITMTGRTDGWKNRPTENERAHYRIAWRRLKISYRMKREMPSFFLSSWFWNNCILIKKTKKQKTQKTISPFRIYIVYSEYFQPYLTRWRRIIFFCGFGPFSSILRLISIFLKLINA